MLYHLDFARLLYFFLLRAFFIIGAFALTILGLLLIIRIVPSSSSAAHLYLFN